MDLCPNKACWRANCILINEEHETAEHENGAQKCDPQAIYEEDMKLDREVHTCRRVIGSRLGDNEEGLEVEP